MSWLQQGTGKLDFSSLRKALGELEEILQQPKNKYIVAGTIQCFEFTFELSWKMLQRVLKAQGVVTGSPMQAFRAGFKAQLIEDVETWAAYLKQRNLTTHTYNQDVAEEVFRAAATFPKSVKSLLNKLQEESK